MKTLRKTPISLALAASLGMAVSAFDAGAVNLATDGIGEVAIAPYYTTRNGWSTLINLTNTADKPIAVRLRIHEGKNTRDVMDFTIAMSAHDRWVAVLKEDNEGAPVIDIRDTDTCIIGPKSKEEEGRRPVVRGDVQEQLRVLSFTEDDADGGGNDERQHEGYVTAFVLGYAEPEVGIGWQIENHKCEDLVGPFTKDQITDTVKEFGEPINALKFNFRLLNPEKGIEAGAQAVTWANFFNSAAAVEENPNASTIYPDGGATPETNSGCTIDRGAKRRGEEATWNPTDTADLSCRNLITAQESDDFLDPSLNDAFPPIGFFMDDKTNGMWVTDYGQLVAAGLTTATGKVRGVDAVSATIMRSAVINEWSINERLDTESSWVVTFPTKAFYVDRSDSKQAAVGAGGARSEAEYAGRGLPYAPFDQVFTGGESRNFVKFTLYDHEQNPYECKETFSEEGFGVSPGDPTVTRETCEQYLSYETNVLNFTRNRTTKPGGVFPDSKLVAGAGVDFEALKLGVPDSVAAGWMKLDMLNGSGANSQPTNPKVGLPVKRYPDTTLTGVIQGLPVIGFMIKHREGLYGPETNYVSIIEHGYMRSSTVPEPSSPVTVP